MPIIKMISESEATGKTAEIYHEIRTSLGIDFVPKTVMQEPGKIDGLTREVIAVAVSAVMGCDY
jgi:alkylhydroperoxidase/carboxymuconolactone decarboxylase family protein YurZ